MREPLPRIGDRRRRAAEEQAVAAVEMQDRRATHARSVIEVRRGPSHSHSDHLTPWREKHSCLSWSEAVTTARAVNVLARSAGDDERKRKTRIIGTERHSKKAVAPSSRLTDNELFGWTRNKLKHVPPCKAELHRGQCYESELRPWRHAYWTGVPSPPLPRRMWRKAPTGVLTDNSRTHKHDSSALPAAASKRAERPGVARMSLAATVAVGMSTDDDQAAVDSGIRRFMTREQDVVQAISTKFPRLGVSVRLLEKFLADHEEQLRDRTGELSTSEKIDQLFDFFDIEGDLSAGKTTAIEKTLTNISNTGNGGSQSSGGRGDWFLVWQQRAKLVDGPREQLQPVTREQFSLIYMEPECRGTNQLEDDHAFLRTTFAVTRTLIKPQTAQTRDSFARLYLNERDESGGPLVGDATVFFSHAWRYNFVTLVNTIITHLQALEAKSKTKQPQFAWIDIMSMPQHGALPASVLQTEVRSATGQKSVAKSQAKAEDSTNASLKWAMVFANAVGTMSELVLILEPWHNPMTLGRSWCLWEILAAVLHNVKLTITMPERERVTFVRDLGDSLLATQSEYPLSEDACLVGENAGERFGDIVRVFSAVRSEHANAQETADRTMIHEAIRKTIGFAKLDQYVKPTTASAEAILQIVVGKLREWLLAEACNALNELPDDVRLHSPLGSAIPRLMHDMGKASEAGRMLRERYELCVRHHGKQQSETIEAAGNLAVNLRQAAQKISPLERDMNVIRRSEDGIAEAETLSREVLAHWESCSSTDGDNQHDPILPAALIARSNLAVVLLTRFCMAVEHGDQDYKRATKDMAKLRSCVKSNSLSLDAMPYPARMLIESESLLRSVMDSLEQAKIKCLRDRRRARPTHPNESDEDDIGTGTDMHTLGKREAETLSNLSQVLFAGGESQLGQAELICSRALYTARKHFHADDEVILKLQCGLAHMKFTVAQLNTVDASPQDLLVSQAKQREAIELYESVFQVRRRLFGMDNEDTQNVASALARLRKMQVDPYSPFLSAA